jgi:acyl dehydratase
MSEQTPISPPWSQIAVGDELPVLDLPLTASVIVAGAIASRDFMPVHHDKDYAIAQGAPDIFMNILTTNGYVSRYVTNWAGPEAMIEKIAIRLGVPALPGAKMRFTGSVASTERTGSFGRVEVKMSGTTDIGDHVTGTVALTLPIDD